MNYEREKERKGIMNYELGITRGRREKGEL